LVVKWLIYRQVEGNWVVCTCFRGVLVSPVSPVVCIIVFQQQFAVQSGPEQGIQLLLMDMLLMMWQVWWAHGG
jgi:hypothetical protein